jgi:acyl dehydratase
LILVGDAERTVRAGLDLRLQPSPWWFARADLGVNWTRNDGFEPGAEAVRFVGLVEAGARVRLGAAPALRW